MNFKTSAATYGCCWDTQTDTSEGSAVSNELRFTKIKAGRKTKYCSLLLYFKY